MLTDPLGALNAALGERYTVERELGAGGMATVYLALDVKHGRKVAIKVLRPEIAAVIGAERFVREIRTIAALQHPHILGLIDSGEVQGTAYFVMPFVEGESLRDRLNREQQLPIADAVTIAAEVAGALDYAHRHGVIHRDIKPENILLHDRQAMVADFGIALALTSAGGTRLTDTGISIGTPAYMSPEQAMGEREITARSDIYGLGCVTYEMLLGEPPFTGPNAQAIVAKVLTDEPRSPSLQRRSVPPEVDAAVLTALAKLPADRFDSAAEFAHALKDDTARTRPSPSQRSSVLARPLQTAGRTALTLGAVCVGSVAVGWLLHRVPAVPPSRPARFAILPEPGARLDQAPHISADGSTIGFITRDKDGTFEFNVRPLEAPAPRRVEGAREGDAFAFAPDGKAIVMRRNGALEIIQLDGRPGRMLTDLRSIDLAPIGLAWGNDGAIYYSIWPEGVIHRIPPTGSSIETVAKADPGYRLFPEQILPDDRSLLVWVDSIGSSTNLWGIVDLQHHRLAAIHEGYTPRYVAPGYIVYGDSTGRLLGQRFNLGSTEPVGPPRPLTGSDEAWSFDLSLDGTLVTKRFTSKRSVRLFDRSGKGTDIFTASGLWGARLSPDGRRLAYAAAGAGTFGFDLWLFDLSARTSQRLTTDGADNTDPQWSPDGRFIAYAASHDSVKDLYIRSVDGNEPPRVLLRRPGTQWPSDWGRTGHIVFTDISPAGVWSIDAVADTGGPSTLWFSNGFPVRAARLSPDGRWAAYTSNETGRNEVYLQSFPRPTTKVLVSAEGGRHPIWRGDGRELYYWSGNTLIAATLAWNPTPVVTKRTPLFDAPYLDAAHASYDATRDGTRFLVIVDEGTGQFEVTLNLLATP